MTAPFRIEPLAAAHAREQFDCGVEVLDRYLAQQASQDVRRHVSACYVAMDANTGKVAAYYTLAAGGVPLTDLPESMAKRLPRYPSVPVGRLGRLAVDRVFQGQGLGGALLADAAMRALRAELAVYALVVEAKDDAAAAFYLHHGFVNFGGLPRQLIASLKQFERSGR